MSPIPPALFQALEAASLPATGASTSGKTITLLPGQRLFARALRSRKDIAQARGEAEGLHYMRLTSELAPQLYHFGVSEKGSGQEEAVILSEYLDMGGRMTEEGQRELARGLARMHRPLDESGRQRDAEMRRKNGLPSTDGTAVQGKFGFPVPTHCGVTEQDNTWDQDWATFFGERRLGDMVRRTGDASIQAEVIPLLLKNIQPPPVPVILHGDLWSGNKGMATGRPGSSAASPAIFDPAAYFGHNEADLGIMYMFGGFSADFFDEYHKHHPRSSPHYEERQKLYELYHHLNHTLMFGGGYKSGALSIMRALNKWADLVDQ